MRTFTVSCIRTIRFLIIAESLTIPVNLDSSKFTTLLEQYNGDIYSIESFNKSVSCNLNYSYFICECLVATNSHNALFYMILLPNSTRVIGKAITSSSFYTLKLIYSNNVISLFAYLGDTNTSPQDTTYGYIDGSVICIGIT